MSVDLDLQCFQQDKSSTNNCSHFLRYSHVSECNNSFISHVTFCVWKVTDALYVNIVMHPPSYMYILTALRRNFNCSGGLMFSISCSSRSEITSVIKKESSSKSFVSLKIDKGVIYLFYFSKMIANEHCTVHILLA